MFKYFMDELHDMAVEYYTAQDAFSYLLDILAPYKQNNTIKECCETVQSFFNLMPDDDNELTGYEEDEAYAQFCFERALAISDDIF